MVYNRVLDISGANVTYTFFTISHTTMRVVIWGAGGGGWVGGGGGGAYADATFSATIGQATTITLGRSGYVTGGVSIPAALSEFSVAGVLKVRATFGANGSTSGGGAGGLASGCTGDVKFSGGDGGAPGLFGQGYGYGGGGGGGARAVAPGTAGGVFAGGNLGGGNGSFLFPGGINGGVPQGGYYGGGGGGSPPLQGYGASGSPPRVVVYEVV